MTRMVDTKQRRVHANSTALPILAAVKRELVFRNVVCREEVGTNAFDVDAFAERLSLGKPEDRIVVGDVSVTEWEKARLQIRPERVQFGFRESADADLVKQGVGEFLTRVDELAPDGPILFNAGMELTLEEGDSDPSEGVLDVDALAGAMGGTGGRGGVTLVYHDALSRWWVELTPSPDAAQAWMFDFNRRFEDFPDPGDSRDEVVAWFVDVQAYLLAQFETIFGKANK